MTDQARYDTEQKKALRAQARAEARVKDEDLMSEEEEEKR